MLRKILLILFVLTIISGCLETEQRESFDLDHAVEIVKTLQTTNAASSPLNPLAVPIGAGLTGLVAMLEALRRVEKGKRKYAEHELNNNKNNKSNS